MIIFAPLLLATVASASTQTYVPPVQPYGQVPQRSYQAYAQPAATDVNAALATWRRLRQSEGYAFADYAYFLATNSGWPGEAGLRRSAEKAMRPGEAPLSVAGFFRTAEPISGNGWARLADSHVAMGRSDEALVAARNAWRSGDLSAYDEAVLLSRYSAQFSPADHDRRFDALMFAKKVSDAQRIFGLTSPSRRASFAARIAMFTRAPDAEAQFAGVAGQVASDAGLMIDRVRYLRDYGNEQGARQLAARQHDFVHRPVEVERYYETLVSLAKGAAASGQWSTAYNIARQVDDAFGPGGEVMLKSYGIRDEYTTLTWLAGNAALQGLGRPGDAVSLFDRYARGGRSLQVATKGWYWAGRAAAQAGRMTEATNYFQRAAATPELYYGQLSLERLGRTVPAPGPLHVVPVTEAQRQAFQNKRLVRAVRLLGSQGQRSEQTLFIRALSEAVETQHDRILATELGSAIGRQDLAVWTARSARNSGTAFYTRAGFPTHSGNVPGGRLWSLVHGITRQESSFDRAAVSHAGARGLMQLMPGTANEQAGKMGYGYDMGRLTSDPAYNVMLGSAYFQRLVNQWDGNYPLAVASYNAGAGNVRKWIRAYGDPRGGDIVTWIERIPFDETRGYVQRVLENSVVYDRLNPSQLAPQSVHISAYLGKSSRPG
ncbi:MAG TPA: lytic transglycosylase domain-containing protein [Sphingomicrobium sp.]|nr:lytic transglycosylase domain-containing protein [Sphingomicrobium sp.]